MDDGWMDEKMYSLQRSLHLFSKHNLGRTINDEAL